MVFLQSWYSYNLGKGRIDRGMTKNTCSDFYFNIFKNILPFSEMKKLVQIVNLRIMRSFPPKSATLWSPFILSVMTTALWNHIFFFFLCSLYPNLCTVTLSSTTDGIYSFEMHIIDICVYLLGWHICILLCLSIVRIEDKQKEML